MIWLKLEVHLTRPSRLLRSSDRHQNAEALPATVASIVALRKDFDRRAQERWIAGVWQCGSSAQSGHPISEVPIELVTSPVVVHQPLGFKGLGGPGIWVCHAVSPP